MKHAKRALVAFAVVIYHSHGYSFFIDTWVLIDLAMKSEPMKFAWKAASALK